MLQSVVAPHTDCDSIDAMMCNGKSEAQETLVNILLFAGSPMSVFVWGCPDPSTGLDLAAGLTVRSGILLAAAALPHLHEKFSFTRTPPSARLWIGL